MGGIGVSLAMLAGCLPRSKHLILDVRHCQTKAKAFMLAAKESRGRRRQKNIGKVSQGAEFQNVPAKLISLPLLRKETSPEQ